MNSSRRTCLRALGLSAGLAPFLPVLDSYAQPAPKRRLLVFHHPHGVPVAHWRSSGSERDWQLGRALSLLSPHKERLVVLQGLDNKVVRTGLPGGAGASLSTTSRACVASSAR